MAKYQKKLVMTFTDREVETLEACLYDASHSLWTSENAEEGRQLLERVLYALQAQGNELTIFPTEYGTFHEYPDTKEWC